MREFVGDWTVLGVSMPYTALMGNMKVFLLMAALTAVFVLVGGSIGGEGGMLVAFLMAALLNLFAWFNSGNAALRAFRARILTQAEAPQLYEIVDRLRRKAGLPMPRLAVAPQLQPNAFASGRNADNAVVCVTQGLLRDLDRAELEGVLAHELGHIKNGDMLLQTVTATLAGAVSMMSQFGAHGAAGPDGRARMNPLAILLAPFAATLIQFAISRSREFKADATASEITGRPLDLAGALAKINATAKQVPMQVPVTMAPLAQVDPLQAFGGGVARLFSTHPPVDDRIARLHAMAAGGRNFP